MGDHIFTMFLFSGAARQFEKGNPRYVAGMSGAELAKETVLKITGKEMTEPEEFFIDKSPERYQLRKYYACIQPIMRLMRSGLLIQ